MEKAFVICACGGSGDDYWDNNVGVMFDGDKAHAKVSVLNAEHARLSIMAKTVSRMRQAFIDEISVLYEDVPDRPRGPAHCTPEALRKYNTDMTKWQIVAEQVDRRNQEKRDIANRQLGELMKAELAKLPQKDIDALGYTNDSFALDPYFDTDVTYYVDEIGVLK